VSGRKSLSEYILISVRSDWAVMVAPLCFAATLMLSDFCGPKMGAMSK
jgi:hypothetical protein